MGSFFKSKHKKFLDLFLFCWQQARLMVRTVQLLRHDAYCPIKAEIRAFDSQSDLNTNKIVVVVVAFVVIIMWHFGRFKLLTTSTKKVSAIHQKHEILYLLLGKLMRV